MGRIGIFGGTFDPIHIGHLYCAEQAMDELGLEYVIFLPASNPAFKQDSKIEGFADRYEMCRIAIADNPRFKLSDVESRRSGITYTVDTLLELRSCMPDDDLYFILGSDSFITLDKWKDTERLSRLATFVSISRHDFNIDEDQKKRLDKMGFDYEILKLPYLDISSTSIRRSISEGRTIRYLVPDGVLEYIQCNDLYRD